MPCPNDPRALPHFRALTTACEIEAAMSIRVERYRAEPDLRRMVSGSGIAGDAFDEISEHFGVFASDREGSALLGAVRLTEAPRERARGSRPPLPLLHYLPSPAHDEVLDLATRALAQRRRVFEIGRLVIDRQCVLDDSALARRVLLALVSGLTAELARRGPETLCFASCHARRVAGYRRFGFEPLCNVPSALTPRLGRRSHLLVGSPH